MSAIVSIVIIVVVMRMILPELRAIMPMIGAILMLWMMAKLFPATLGPILGAGAFLAVVVVGFWFMFRGLVGRS